MRTLYLNKIIALCLLLLTIITPVSADMGSFLEQTVVQYDAPLSYSSGGEHFLFGGGIHVRTPSMTIQPFSITPPSFKGGCGGLDITFGAFRYLDVEKFVKFVKAMAANAPGFAFQLALDVICPKCQDLMNKLSALANQINALQFDSCKILQQTKDMLVGPMRQALGTGESSPQWMKVAEETLDSATKQVEKIVDFLNTFGQRSFERWIVTGNNTFLDKVIRDGLSFFSGNESGTSQDAKVLGYFFGNMAINRVIPGSGGDPTYTPVRIPALSANADDFRRWLGFGPDCPDTITIRAQVLRPESSNDDPRQTRTWTVAEENLTVTPVCRKISNAVNDLFNKYVNRQPLSPESIQLLGVLPMPMIRFLNIASAYPELITSDEFKEAIRTYISAKIGLTILSAIKSQIVLKLLGSSSIKSQFDPIKWEAKEWLTDLSLGIYEDLVKEEINAAAGKLQEQMKAITEMANVESTLTAQLMQKGIWQSYMLSRSLVTAK